MEYLALTGAQYGLAYAATCGFNLIHTMYHKGKRQANLFRSDSTNSPYKTDKQAFWRGATDHWLRMMFDSAVWPVRIILYALYVGRNGMFYKKIT